MVLRHGAQRWGAVWGRALVALFCVAVLGVFWPQKGAAQPAEPMAITQGFYKEGFSNLEMPLSARLQALLDAAMENSRKINGPVPGIDFAWQLNAQDSLPGFQTTLRFAELRRSPTAATVQTTFNNARDEEIHFEFVLENGAWVIDDIVYLRDGPDLLSKMLIDGANEKP